MLKRNELKKAQETENGQVGHQGCLKVGIYNIQFYADC